MNDFEQPFDGVSREGQTPSHDTPNEFGGERRKRQRFNRSAEPVSRSSRYQHDGDSSFTPRPRYGNYTREQGEGGYQPRPRYGAGYQPRPQYNRYGGQRDGEGGYQPRPRYGSYSREQGEGGYQPRPQYNRYGGERGEGGYQPRPRYQGGYQQRPYKKNFKPKYNPKRRVEYKEQEYDPTQPLRLNKFLANAGICSRRDADKYIQAGVVSVNGVVVTELGAKVLRSDTVLFHDEPVTAEKKVHVLLNKPKGYVTTSEDPQNRKTVMDLVAKACPERIYPVGRLDRNTTGVLLITNDGELASKLTHPKFLKKKIYHVTLDRNVTAEDMRQIAEGIQLDDGPIRADAIAYASETDKKQVGIEIHSGRNRIVRRIFEELGYNVSKLDRVYFAGLTKKNVKRGDWRHLTEKEVNMLRMGAFE
ncbi:MAG: pseudouridine synthase [Bacteroidales bacterium]|nr:pseudouridine synthase [Candidatus Equimonas enterica]